MDSNKVYEKTAVQKHKVKGIYEAFFKRLLDIVFSGIAMEEDGLWEGGKGKEGKADFCLVVDKHVDVVPGKVSIKKADVAIVEDVPYACFLVADAVCDQEEKIVRLFRPFPFAS